MCMSVSSSRRWTASPIQTGVVGGVAAGCTGRHGDRDADAEQSGCDNRSDRKFERFRWCHRVLPGCLGRQPKGESNLIAASDGTLHPYTDTIPLQLPVLGMVLRRIDVPRTVHDPTRPLPHSSGSAGHILADITSRSERQDLEREPGADRMVDGYSARRALPLLST